ncbi:UTRA domain-containing protein [Streptomyces sp. NPDC014872]|uniref:UTRA domain-containing protein n=1 Tax=Streptomyces sp. NPDC014872 TaxID=3364926 RepID=UPI0036F8C534
MDISTVAQRDDGPDQALHSQPPALLRPPVRRSNRRHAWEKARARKPFAERKATGATEYDTGLTKPELDFSAEYRHVKSNAHLSEVFGIPHGSALLERSYRTSYVGDEHPLGVILSYLVREKISANPELLDSRNEPWPGGTQAQLHTLGIEVGEITEQVTARAAATDEARDLGLREHEPVLALEKIVRDVTGRVVEVAHILLPADRTQLEFHTPLDRW